MVHFSENSDYFLANWIVFLAAMRPMLSIISWGLKSRKTKEN